MGFKISIRLGKFIWTIQFDSQLNEQISQGDMMEIIANAQAQQVHPEEVEAKQPMGFCR